MSSGSWLGHGDGTIGTTPEPHGRDREVLPRLVRRTPAGRVVRRPGVATASRPSRRRWRWGRRTAPPPGAAQAVLVALPDGEQAPGPFPGSADGAYLYSGLHDSTASLAESPPLTIPAEGDAVLHAQVAYQIEPDFDYAFLQVSDNNGASWTTVPTDRSVDPQHEDPDNDPATDLGITGVSGAPASEDPWWSFAPAWVSLSADLSGYAGDTVRVRWRYDTDGATHGSGLAVDSLNVGDLSTGFGSVAGWDFDDFTSVADNVYAVEYSRYYLAENRQYRGYDKTLETGPYSWDYENTAYNRVDQFPYQDGLLVWYANGLYGDNDSTLHPGVGATLPVDAGSDLQLWLDSSGDPTAWADGRLQAYDATFDVDETDPLELTREVGGSEALETLTVPARQSVPVFEDADPDAYLDDLVAPYSLWYSTSVAGAGTEIQVLSSDESTGRMVVKIGKRFVAALGGPSIAGTAQLDQTLTATAPAWFHTGVTTTVAWLRDGNPIVGASGTSYRVQVADVGHTLGPGHRRQGRLHQHGCDDERGPGDSGRRTGRDGRTEDLRGGSSRGQAERGRCRLGHGRYVDLLVDSRRQAVGTGTSYALKPADAGKKVTVTETFTSPGYVPATASASSATVAKAKVSLAAKHGKAKKGKRVAVAIRATSPGVTVPGRVR